MKAQKKTEPNKLEQLAAEVKADRIKREQQFQKDFILLQEKYQVTVEPELTITTRGVMPRVVVRSIE